MGRIDKREYEAIIPPEPDRYADRVLIYRDTKGNYIFNFRNLQLTLSPEEFRMWKEAFKVSKEKLGDKMQHDL